MFRIVNTITITFNQYVRMAAELELGEVKIRSQRDLEYRFSPGSHEHRESRS